MISADYQAGTISAEVLSAAPDRRGAKLPLGEGTYRCNCPMRQLLRFLLFDEGFFDDEISGLAGVAFAKASLDAE